MPNLAENYFAQKSAVQQRFNFIVWFVTALLAVSWLALIVAAPMLKANGFHGAANVIYAPLGFVCHQNPERSFHIFGEVFAVCARCAGVYFGLAFGVLAYPLFRSLNDLEPLPRVWLLLSPVPTGIDFLLGFFGVWENTHFSRFFTASILGVGIAFFLIPGIVEISRFTIGHLTFSIYQKNNK